MNTLHAPPEAPVPTETPRVVAPTPRPSLIERTAMRVGLRLLLWGRHRSRRRVSRDAHARQLLAEQVRRDYDRAAAYAMPTRTIR
ncbi:hypothetical protein [Microbacterium sp. 18062]|uniref:hypothetical protein n=1 Tax=Microbacterium sp. 18062 TaxID=2681410 RepID=UPI0013579BF8|nr:hypothetical protein [Microbacterium sp. 18062]